MLFAIASPGAQHRPGVQLTAPSMISKWKDKHRKFVVTVVPAKSLTESWAGKEIQNNKRRGRRGREASGSFIFRLQLIRQRGKEKAEEKHLMETSTVCDFLTVQGKKLWLRHFRLGGLGPQFQCL